MLVLEAQHIGVPVITTRRGAMKDYTMHGAISASHVGAFTSIRLVSRNDGSGCSDRAGVSVKPVQREWLNIGYVATPDVSGVAEALRSVANGTCCDQNGERQRAVDVVTNSMSRTSVGWAFDDLVDTISRRPLLPSVLRYGSTSCSVLREQDHEWVVIADRQHVRIAAS